MFYYVIWDMVLLMDVGVIHVNKCNCTLENSFKCGAVSIQMSVKQIQRLDENSNYSTCLQRIIALIP